MANSEGSNGDNYRGGDCMRWTYGIVPGFFIKYGVVAEWKGWDFICPVKASRGVKREKRLT